MPMRFTATRTVTSTLRRLAAASLLAATFGATAVAAEFKVDLSHSAIQFKTMHLGMSWLTGRFNSFEGTMNYDPEAGPEAQSISITIDTSSIDTNWADRDKHLRSADFFNVDEYPTATFESTGYEGDANGGTLSGNLTLLGVTKPISFEITRLGEGEDPWGGYRAGFEGSYTLTRSDFGMDYNLGPAAEQIELELLIEAIRAE